MSKEVLNVTFRCWYLDQ